MGDDPHYEERRHCFESYPEESIWTRSLRDI